MLEKFKLLWTFLSGRKTKIGTLITFIPVILGLLGQEKWADLAQQIIQVLFSDPVTAVGASVATLGLAHGIVKEVTRKK
jgi:hypothetical protein